VFGNKSAYPVYMTIGNIPKALRRKSTKRAQILIAYLPTTKLSHVTNDASRRRILTNLNHACLRRVLSPLETAGIDGVAIASGDGVTRRTHPIVASYTADYPEQIFVTGAKNGECPKGLIPHDELGNNEAECPPRNLEAILDALALADDNPPEFTKACAEAHVKPIYHPFWLLLPFLNIFRSITPDILHQILQGGLKHLVAWLKIAFGGADIDARCKHLPPNHNIRHFLNGITGLSRVTGKEHDEMSRILLGLVVNLRLPGNRSPARLICVVRALLDFLYLSQYPVHTSDTLSNLTDALQRFHSNKNIFIDLGIREHFKIPKFHSYQHYVASIKLFGTTDNYNTQATERLHIDFAKEAYRATNTKDEYPQMTRWLERREKLLRHKAYIAWRLTGDAEVESVQAPILVPRREMRMPKHPSVNLVPLQTLANEYGATYIRDALARFIVATNHPDWTARQVEAASLDVFLPFQKLPVYHKIKFYARLHGQTSVVDTIHARPVQQKNRRHRHSTAARFDTALVNTGGGQAIGVQGMHFDLSLPVAILLIDVESGFRVVQVRVVFTLPQKIATQLFPPHRVPPRYLAYVEWFTPFTANPEPHHLMYKINRNLRNGQRIASIIPIHGIRRSVHLLPKSGPSAPDDWTSTNVLEKCNTFFVNSLSDRHAYITIR